MTARPPRTPKASPMPLPPETGEPFGVGIAYYRTDHELTFYLRAFQHMSDRRMVVVLGLRDGSRVMPADIPTNVRLILTQAGAANPNEGVGWFVPDPLQAVIVGMTGRQPEDGMILLFPVDWQGLPSETLIEKARRWRSGPHAALDDVYFNAD